MGTARSRPDSEAQKGARPDTDPDALDPSASPTTDEGGTVEPSVPDTAHVTAGATADTRPPRSDEAFSLPIEHAPIAICIVDEAFRLRAINARAEVVFRGMEPLLGRDFADVARATWPEPFAAAVLDRVRHSLATGEPYAAEPFADAGPLAAHAWQLQRIALPDGTACVVCYAYDLGPLRDAERRAAEERTRAEARLRDSEARLKLALEASGMGTFVWHLDEGRAEPDARTLELFGVGEPGPALPVALETLLHPDSRARLAAAVQRALDPTQSGEVREDVCVRRPDGTERWLGITARIIFEDEPRRAVRVAGIIADVDDRKRVEESLRATGARLTDADRRKDEFLAVLAHELRNPLAPIRAGLELIRLSGGDTAAVERTRAIMERQVGHMVRLIDDLLDVSRITSGKIQLQRRSTSLDVLVTTAIEANREAMQASRLRLRLTLPETPICVDVDPTRGVQVISNILHNAVKFTDAGGEIRVDGRLEERPGLAPLATLTIADTGVGISAEMLPRVFDLFTQDREASARSSTGLGIGLALARRLVELHGGSLEAHSEGHGRGSAFTLRLPVAAPGSDPPPASSPRPPADSLQRRVVVIDDNLDAANAMAMLVAAFGGEARVAVDGPGGIEQVLAWEPDLVLLDIGMPGMDGYETCRRLRAHCGSTVSIVALTGWGQEQHKREATRAGFDAHLTKPADPAALERLLASTPQRPR